jgi:phosphopantothenoylcysteine decarboxylase/phosphopantothenate--cysteine ligase
VFKAVWSSSEKSLIKEGEEKLRESNADAVVVNDVSKSDRGFQVDTNEVIVIKKDNAKKKITLRSKQDVAEELLSFIFNS